jgi:hypothetical protein
MKNGQQPPEEPQDYTTVVVTLDVDRAAWEIAEQFAARLGIKPLDLIGQAVEQRIQLFQWLLSKAEPRVTS